VHRALANGSGRYLRSVDLIALAVDKLSKGSPDISQDIDELAQAVEATDSAGQLAQQP
jgi:hypothetical protein